MEIVHPLFPPIDREQFQNALRDRRRKIRLACLTEDDISGADGSALRDDRRGFSHSRMWTQYASAQQGVCLVFDREALVTSAAKRFGDRLLHGRVEYVAGFDQALSAAEMIRNDLLDPTWHHRNLVVPSLLIKNDDWRSEREYRLLVDDWNTDEACLLPIAGAVKGLVLGSGFRARDLPVASAIVTKFDLGDSVAHMILNSGVLQPWPARRPEEGLHLWTDAETRSPLAFESRS